MPNYTIQSGDTLGAIAQKYGTTVQALQGANPTITNPNLIYTGASLNIPSQLPSAPAVYSSAGARDQVSQNMNTVLQAGAPNFTPYTSPNMSVAPTAPTATSIPTGTTSGTSVPSAPTGVSVTSPSGASNTTQNITSQINTLLQDPNVIRGLPTDLYNSIKVSNELAAKSNALLSSGEQAAQTNNYRSLNDYVTEYKKTQEEFTRQQNDLYQKLVQSRSISPEETSLKNQLLGVQDRIAALGISTAEGVQGEYGLGRPLALSTGRALKLQQQGLNIKQSLINDANSVIGRLR